MALLPTNQKDQIKVAVAALSLAGVILYWNFSWSKRHAELTTLEARVDTLEEKNAAAKQAVNRGAVAKLKSQAGKFESDLAVMRRLVPSANEVPMLLEDVSTAARGAGLELSEVSPEGVVPGNEFDTYKYQIGVSGGYHQIAQFLTNVGTLPRIVAPINVQLTPSAGIKGAKAGSAPKSAIDAKLEIQTYVVHTGAPVVVQQAGNAKGKS